ncbi:MAG: OsmC family peroxiredoxin, partial [Actinomycetota bacterium]
MAGIEREATCVWEGDLAHGAGRLSAASSVAFSGLALSLPTRIGAPGDQTSPEELLAAAHAGCFAMALTSILTRAGVPPGRLDVACRVRVDEDPERGFRVGAASIAVRAEVDGLARVDHGPRVAIAAASASRRRMTPAPTPRSCATRGPWSTRTRQATSRR